MKKRKFALLGALALVLTQNALGEGYYRLPIAQGNPGDLNTDPEYPVGGGLEPGWQTILNGSNSTPTWSVTQTLIMPFQFNGEPVSSFKVSSTGVLTFSNTRVSAPGTPPSALPSASIPDKSVMVWGITGTGSSDNIVTKVFGEAPNRQLWISFSSYTMPGLPSSWTYWSIVLEEKANHIYVVDQRNANGSLSVTIGIQVDQETAYQVSGSPFIGHRSGNDPTAVDNYHYSFLPGEPPAVVFDNGFESP